MEKEPLVVSNKSCKAYFLVDGSKVYFSGDFDSGNLQKAEQLSPLTYRLTPGFDKTRQSTRKNFFHFKTQGFKHCIVKFIVTRVYLLQQFIGIQESQQPYHPVARVLPNGNFEKIKKEVKIYYNSMDEPELSFVWEFDHQNWVQFAFTYPYSYQDNETLIKQMSQLYKNNLDIYFHDEILIKTSEQRKVHVLTITDRRNIAKERQEGIEGLFEQGPRPFKINKPIVIFSARVHPGQTPGSYCMEGVIRFLLNEKDYRSYLLRKNFHFILIPMLNPEGVFEGMFRNDLNGMNLNRMYVHCEPKKHKSIWGVKKYLQSLRRVDFFFDLHAHPSRKGFFIYGNAFDQFLHQTEAQIFSKMIQYNCPYFQNLDCIYSQKAMIAKDKYDNFTKEGCARVFYYNLFKFIHSYTVECGYFAPTKLNPFPPQRGLALPGSDYTYTADWQTFSTKQYTPESYMLLGKSLLISVMDLFHINPFTRIATSDFKSINSLRKFTAQRVYNQVQRFRLIDSNCYRKIKQVASLIEQKYYLPRFKEHGLTISENYGMKHKKKTFSLNAKIYGSRSSKSHQKNQIANFKQQQTLYKLDKREELEQSLNDQKQQKQWLNQKIDQKTPKLQKIHVKSVSEQNIRKDSFIESFIKHKLPPQTQKKFKVYKAASVQNLKNKPYSYQKVQASFQGKLSLDKSQKSGQTNRIRQMQIQIMAELMHSKLKKQYIDPKRASDALIKIDRMGSFLRKEGKTITRLPAIHQLHQNQQSIQK